MTIKDLADLIAPVISLLGVAFLIYRTFREPDIKANDRLNLIEQRCIFIHKSLDENILAIKENHLRHLESDVKEINDNIQKIEIAIVQINAELKK